MMKFGEDSDSNLDRMLLYIADNLREGEVKQLKFLCRDVLPLQKLENSNSLTLLETLLQKNVINSNNYTFLTKCLQKIQRIDLMKRVNRGSNIIEDFQPNELSHFRSLLFDVAMDLRRGDIAKLGFFYRKNPKYIAASDGLDLFTFLMDADIITERSFGNLVQNLSSINRKDLANKLEVYCRNPVEQRRLPIPEARSQQRHDQESRRPTDVIRLPTEESRGRGTMDGYYKMDAQPRGTMDGYYKMDAQPRGYCIIINNIEFKELGMRGGAEIDQRNLCKLFKDFNFNVTEFQNLCSEDMKNYLKENSDKDHSCYDCFVCFILSHGNKGNVFGSDDISVEIDDLIDLFNADKCPSLKNKPKLFFIQACQNEQYQVDCSTIEEDNSRKSLNPLKKADISIFMSTISGHYSYRDTESGTRFIQYVVEEFSHHAKEKDFANMITAIIGKVSADGDIRCRQLPIHTSTLRKHLRLH